MTYYFLPNGKSVRSSVSRAVYSVFSDRIDKGWTVEDALKHAKRRAGKGTAENNLKYRLSTGETLRSYSHAKGLNYDVIKTYVKQKGLSPDDAVKRYCERKGVTR